MISYILTAMLSTAAGAQASPFPSTAQPTPSQPSPLIAPRGGGGRPALFLSPMGEPFRDQSSRVAGLQAWFVGTDKDRSGWLSVQEVNDDSTRFFATLDSGKDGEIDPDDVTRYENEVAPEIHTAGLWSNGGGAGMRGGGGNGGGGHRGGGGGGGHRGGGGGGHRGGGGDFGGSAEASPAATVAEPAETGLQGAGRFGLLNIPEPVISADADLNRGVSLAEFQKAATARFVLLDTNRDGKLTPDELQARLPSAPRGRGGRRNGN